MKANLLITLSAVTLLTTACASSQPMTNEIAASTLTSLATTAAYPNANRESYKQAAITGATAGLVNSVTPTNTGAVGAIASSALVGLATSAVQKGATSEQMKQSVISGALTGLINSTLNSTQKPAQPAQR